MSGFEKDWLTLREPADAAARQGMLVDELARHLAGIQDAQILDIGCGTGSTWRSIGGRLPGVPGWTLLDHDPVLLEDAERRIGTTERVRFARHDLNDINGLPLEGVDIITASALFDLCSEGFCEALAGRMSLAGCGLYSALNYNGAMEWSVSHPLDRQMVALFNSHQRTDKGLGPALGPDAGACLSRILLARGYSVMTGDSSWRLDVRHADLQVTLLHGLRQPLMEMSAASELLIDDWLDYRVKAVLEPDSACVVGHVDLLALPARAPSSAPPVPA